MKLKELVRWTEAAGLAEPPWISKNWQSVAQWLLKLLATEIKRRGSGEEEVTQPTMQLDKILQLAEVSLGAPQLMIAADLNSSEIDSQLGLYTTMLVLRYSLGETDPCIYRALESPTVTVVAESQTAAICPRCRTPVLLVERTIVNGRVFHRNCLKCSVCARQLHIGAFRGDDTKLECVDHFINRILFDDELHHYGLAFNATQAETKLPPPRPPPPKIVLGDASNAAIDGSEKGSDNSEKNWEVLSYPEQLNPFGSDDEEDEDEEEKSDTVKVSNNPFSESESDDESTPDSAIGRDRSFENVSSPIHCNSLPRSTPSAAGDDASCNNPFDDSDETEPPTEVVMKKSPTPSTERPKSQPPAPPKPPRQTVTAENVDRAESASKTGTLPYSAKKYRAPLPPMVYRPKVQVSPNEKVDSLEDCLRQIQKIEFRMVEIELKGKKIESRIRRTSSQPDFEWKKNKDVEVYADAIMARCEALRRQSVAVHKYMEVLVASSHDELERQMKQIEEQKSKTGHAVSSEKEAQLTELLVELMQIKNDLNTIDHNALPPAPSASTKPHKVKKVEKVKTEKVKAEKVKPEKPEKEKSGEKPKKSVTQKLKSLTKKLKEAE
ncbi:MICAL-like protein 2 [Aphelenchoides avenae]|nr:MICAL-like protein 2 [Aphelenchus avenae]